MYTPRFAPPDELPADAEERYPVPKVQRVPRGTFSPSDPLRQVSFKFDALRYPALVKILDRAPSQGLSGFIREQITEFRQQPARHYISKRYDLSYKPAHITENAYLTVAITMSTRKALKKAAAKKGCTVSALVRVLVERRMDEIQSIFGP